ncbi:MAG: hypothetical protein WC477_06830 [Patescibacteria group bacterium]
MSDTIELFAVQNSEGKWFHRKGYGGYGETWCEEQHKARIYTKLSQARAQVTYFANHFPSYPVPHVVRLVVGSVEVVDESERVSKVKRNKEVADAKRNAAKHKRVLEKAFLDSQAANEELRRLTAETFPPFLVLGSTNGVSVRRHSVSGMEAVYYRPAGAWYANVTVCDEGLMAEIVGGRPGKFPAFPISEEVFVNENKGYM